MGENPPRICPPTSGACIFYSRVYTRHERHASGRVALRSKCASVPRTYLLQKKAASFIFTFVFVFVLFFSGVAKKVEACGE